MGVPCGDIILDFLMEVGRVNPFAANRRWRYRGVKRTSAEKRQMTRIAPSGTCRANVSNLAHYARYRADTPRQPASYPKMPRFEFQVQHDRTSESPVVEEVLTDIQAARKVALGICADLAKDIVAGLSEDSEWRLDVRNEAGDPVFTLRLLAETVAPRS